MQSGSFTGRRWVRALILSGLAVWTADPCHADPLSCPARRETVWIAAVVDELDLATEDGRTLKLAGLDHARPTPTHPDLGEAARRWLEETMVGRETAIALLAPLADRWDRYPALVSVPLGAEGPALGAVPATRSVNESLIAAGWARARPDAALASCVPAWLSVEDKARRAGLGLWADPYYAILGADDRSGLAERAGTMVLVEGRLRSEESRGRVAFRLGGASGMKANVTREGGRSLARAGVDPHGLSGAELRVRGVLDDRFGPTIDVTDAGQIEVLDAKDPGGAGTWSTRRGATVSSKDDAPAGP